MAKRNVVASVYWALKSREHQALAALYATRRAAFIARLRLLAEWHRAEIEIDIAPDVRLGRGLRVIVWPNSRNVVRIGRGTEIGDRALIRLNDGQLLIGDNVEVRRDCIFWLWKGRLELAGDNIISWGNVFHCSDSIRFGRLSSTNEWVTVVDSSHFFTEPDVFFYHNTKTGPIEVGYNSWICAKATLARNAKVGDHCIIASNSLLTGEVPSGHLASGVPATVVRPVRLDWLERPADELPGASDARG